MLSPRIFAALLLNGLLLISSVIAETTGAGSQNDSGPIGYWKMDKVAEGVVADSSPSGADCVAKGSAPIPQVSGKFGSALDFDGRDCHLEARDSAKLDLTGAFTISFWMNPTEWSEKYCSGIVSKKKSDKDPGYVIYNDGGTPSKITIRFLGKNGASGLTSASDVDEGVWQHWAVTYDPATKLVTWYKNGKPDKISSPLTIGDMSNDAAFQVGHSQTWNGFYCGLLNEIKMYSRALSSEEIMAEYNLHSSIVETAPPMQPVSIAWRVIEPRYPKPEVVVAGCTVREAGAKGDGVTDDTQAFKQAMNAMAEAGGGTVFVPEGHYVIRGTLKVPTGVTLCGDWQKPEPGKPLCGTILMAYAGRGQANGRPFVGLQKCSGIRNMAIWYPEQEAGNIADYPFCIKQLGGDSASMENLTLVNPSRGILIPGGSELHYLHNIYGSPLAVGFEVDFVSDLGRADNLHFSPDYWSDSGLPGAPSKDGPHAKWMRANGTGLLFLRNEWICSQFVSVSGYKIGLEVLASKLYGQTNGELYDHKITHCGTAVKFNDANFAGTSFTDCVLEGDDYGVVTTPLFNSWLLFHTCAIRGGKQAALLDGVKNQAVLFQHCTLSGMVERLTGDLTLLGCSITAPGDHIRLGKNANAVTIAGTKFNGAPRIVKDHASDLIKISPEAVPKSTLPKITLPEDKVCKPGTSKLYVVTEPEWGAKKDGTTDGTAAIQKALDTAGKAGGGIVFLPGGEYAVKGNLTVPSGVELRGVYDVPHHSLGKGSVLKIYAGHNDSKAPPFLVLKARSGLRGVTFLYPEQAIENVVPYPPMIQGRGEDIYVINTCAVNSYNMLDFMTHRCDRHYINYPAGVALKTGIAIGGGSVGGELLNAHLQTHYWERSPYVPSSSGVRGKDRRNLVWEYQHENLDAFLVGDCQDELLYQNCVFGSHIGFHFIAQEGKGASGCRVLAPGVDGSQFSMVFDGLGADGIDVVNAQLVSMKSTNPVPPMEKVYLVCGEHLKSEARLYNTTLWGNPTASAKIHGGALMLDLASFFEYGPFVVDGGKLSLFNVKLSKPVNSKPELDILDLGRVSLIGTLTPQGMRLAPDAPQKAVTTQFENRHEPAIPPAGR